MSNPIPDRVCVDDAKSAFYMTPKEGSNLEITLNGIRQVNNVVEYCISEGWVRRQRRTALGVIKTDEFHQPIIDKVSGVVSVAWR